jgi:hypothetical protein
LQGDPAHELDRQLADVARLLDLVTDVDDEPASHDNSESEAPS